MKPEDAIHLVELAGKDDEKLDLAVVEIAISRHPESSQLSLRRAIYAAAIPHWFDPEILRSLLNDVERAEAEHIFSILLTFSFVESFAARGAFNIHERTRLSLLQWMAREQPDEFRSFSARAAAVFEGQENTPARIECIYHLLVARADDGSRELAKQYNAWNEQGRVERVQALAAMAEEHLVHDRLRGRALAMALDVVGNAGRNHRPYHDTIKLLEKALGIYRELGDKRAEGWSFDDIGRIQLAQGNLDEALNSFRASLVISEALANSEPENALWCREIAISHTNIAGVLCEQSEFDAAIAALNSAIVIRQRLLLEQPRDIHLQRGLAISINRLGEVRRRQGDFELARESFEIAIRLREGCVSEDSTNTHFRRDLSVSYDCIGDTLREQGRLEEALHYHEMSLQLAIDLAKEDKDNALWQRDLAASFDCIGGVQKLQGSLPAALASYQRAVAIVQALLSKYTDDREFQHDFEEYSQRVSEVSKMLRPLPDTMD